MAALRPTFRLAAIGAVGATAAYAGYQHYNSTNFFFLSTAQAESLPSDTKSTLKKMDWKGFTELKLQSSEQVNHNVKRLTFALPTEDSITGISPVTSLLSRHTPDGGLIPVFRPYTPVSNNDEPGTVTFMIKKYPGGKGSSKMHSLQPGDSMLFKTLQEFKYEPNQHESMLLIAGGSGITPLYQLTRAILNNPADNTKISLVYANNTDEDILLRKEFEDLEAKYPGRFRKVFTVSKKTNPQDQTLETGYVTKELLGKAGWTAKKENGQKVLVSGPPPMIEAVAGAKGMAGWTQGSVGGVLAKLGYTSADIHKF